MNFLAGLLLFYMPDEAHAFAGLVMLMKERNLQPYYGRSMSLLQVSQPEEGDPGAAESFPMLLLTGCYLLMRQPQHWQGCSTDGSIRKWRIPRSAAEVVMTSGRQAGIFSNPGMCLIGHVTSYIPITSIIWQVT
jgi:hypothetical protein